MKIVIACDPNAENFKQQLIPYIMELGHEVSDFGSDDPIYANTAIKVGEAVAAGTFDRGILVCGTGLGMAIAANKVKGVYAASICDIYQAERAQLSNHANVITMGSQVIGIELAKRLVKEYLSLTYNPAGRSAAKIARIIAYEQEICPLVES